MNKTKIPTITVLITVMTLSYSVAACTTFCLNDDGAPLFGRNYDWMVDDGLVMVNKRGVEKNAAFVDVPATWTSKYGSVTFNQYGREMPHGGMNEAGLVLDLMWLGEAVYPVPDQRLEIGVLQWVQYQLDNHSIVAEVIASDADVRIRDGSVPLHFLVCDARGDCAVIEFLGGEMTARTGDQLPYAALANSTYDDSIAFADPYLAGCGELPTGGGSLERFTRAADLCARFNGDTPVPPVDYAFSILENVGQGEATMWSIVYDYDGSRIYFRTLAAPEIRYVDTSAFDYSAGTPVQILDMNVGLSGDVSGEFADYSYEANRALIGASFAGTDFLKDIPEETLDAIANIPENMANYEP